MKKIYIFCSVIIAIIIVLCALSIMLQDYKMSKDIIVIKAEENLIIGIDKGDTRCSVYDVMTDRVQIDDAIVRTKFKNLHILSSTINLAGIDIEFMEKSNNDSSFSKGSQLKTRLDKIKDQFDYVIMDCPPSLGLITTNALTASDSVIIPVQCEFFALEGIMQLLNTIMMAQKTLNPNLDIEGVLLTMLDSRTNLGFEVVDDI